MDKLFQLGGHREGIKALVKKDDKIYKYCYGHESLFYKTMNMSNLKLKDYIPTYYGEEEIDLGYGKNKYFKMTNLIYGIKKLCSFELKIGTRSWYHEMSEEAKTQRIKKESKTLFVYGYRFEGMTIYDEKSSSNILFYKKPIYAENAYEIAKNSLKSFLLSHGKINGREELKLLVNPLTCENLQHIMNNLNNNNINDDEKVIFKQMIDKLITKLEKFKNDYKDAGCQIVSSSLFFYYDKTNPLETLDFKMIDFPHWVDKEHLYPEPDGVLFGVENIIKLLKELKEL